MGKIIDNDNISEVLTILVEEFEKWQAPIVTFVAQAKGTPYQVLVATLLSLRTKDEVTRDAVNRLFRKAKTPLQMLDLTEDEIRELIYPVGFYRKKSEGLRRVSRIILDDYNGKVPDTVEELVKLPGVGRKTANLVVVLGYEKPGICVDVHVHRISNRWGYVKTNNPEQTEFALRDKLPAKWWLRYNDLLVGFGQTICKPVSPLCSKCSIEQYCPQLGVERHR